MHPVTCTDSAPIVSSAALSRSPHSFRLVVPRSPAALPLSRRQTSPQYAVFFCSRRRLLEQPSRALSAPRRVFACAYAQPPALNCELPVWARHCLRDLAQWQWATAFSESGAAARALAADAYATAHRPAALLHCIGIALNRIPWFLFAEPPSAGGAASTTTATPSNGRTSATSPS